MNSRSAFVKLPVGFDRSVHEDRLTALIARDKPGWQLDEIADGVAYVSPIPLPDSAPFVRLTLPEGPVRHDLTDRGSYRFLSYFGPATKHGSRKRLEADFAFAYDKRMFEALATVTDPAVASVIVSCALAWHAPLDAHRFVESVELLDPGFWKVTVPDGFVYPSEMNEALRLSKAIVGDLGVRNVQNDPESRVCYFGDPTEFLASTDFEMHAGHRDVRARQVETKLCRALEAVLGENYPTPYRSTLRTSRAFVNGKATDIEEIAFGSRIGANVGPVFDAADVISHIVTENQTDATSCLLVPFVTPERQTSCGWFRVLITRNGQRLSRKVPAYGASSGSIPVVESLISTAFLKVGLPLTACYHTSGGTLSPGVWETYFTLPSGFVLADFEEMRPRIEETIGGFVRFTQRKPFGPVNMEVAPTAFNAAS
jgi:hypothetical protein